MNSPEFPVSSPVVTPDIPISEISPIEKRSISPISAYLSLILKISLCVSITSLLIYFQAAAYSDSKVIEPLGVTISIVCEISLLYLSVSLRRSFVSCFLFGVLFIYNLGVMSFAIKREETQKTISEIREDPNEIMRRSLFEKAISSYDLSAAKRETGNTTKILKMMKDISTEQPSKEPPMLELYKIEAFGLIILRAILMLLNALLIHRIIVNRKIAKQNNI